MGLEQQYEAALAALVFTDERRSFESGFYVDPPGGLAARHVDRLRAEPGARIFVLGGIGTGKSTQLHAIERDLSNGAELRPLAVQVGRYVRLSQPRAGVLVALAALGRLRHLRKAGLSVHASFQLDLARLHGGLLPPMKDGGGLLDDDVLRSEPAALDLPPSGVKDLVRVYQELDRLEESATRRPMVLLVDDLDRVESVDALKGFLQEDLPALRRLNVGLAVAGSIGWRFRFDRDLPDLSDVLEWQRVPDPLNSADDLAFLMNVLRRRVPGELLDDASADLIARASGGVMRDLLGVARSALTAAWGRDRGPVRAEDVGLASEALAARRSLFLSPERIVVIRQIAASGNVDGHQRALEDLLASGDVVMHGSSVAYTVHPAVLDVLHLRDVA